MSRDTFFRLLDMQPVREELELSELQIEMLGDLQTDLRIHLRAAYFNRGSRAAPRGQGNGGRPETTPDIQKIRDQGEKLAGIILDTDQTKRFRQVRLQYEGTRALGRRQFRDQLGVTDKQFEEIWVLLQKQDDRSTLGRPEKNLDESVLALLSEEQQVKFKELRGKAFEFPLRRSSGFGRPR